MAPLAFSAVTSSSEKPHSASAPSVSAPAATGALGTALGVRLKRGGRGLGRAVDVDERVALDVVRVGARLRHREHRREAHLVAGEERDPLGARARAESASAMRSSTPAIARGPSARPGRRRRIRAGRSARAGSRRTSARTTRSTRTRRRRSRTRCRSARRRRAGSCRGPQPPIASRPKKMLISCALPSTIAASTTWPRPTSRAPRARRGCPSRRASRRRRSRRAG